MKPQCISPTAVCQNRTYIILHIPKKRGHNKCLPHSSSCAPGNVLQRAQAGHSPTKPGWGSPSFQSPRTPSWTCSSTESLTYSNIHSVTRGHRGEETEGTAVLLASIKSQRKIDTIEVWISPRIKENVTLKRTSYTFVPHAPSIKKDRNTVMVKSHKWIATKTWLPALY